MNEVVIYTDGGARGNPGPAAVGAVISFGDRMLTHERYIGTATNNHAEYTAVLDVLEKLPEFLQDQAPEATKLHFYLDSLLVVKQVCGEYKVKEANLLNLCMEVRRRLQEIGLPFQFDHVPRKMNSHADKLVNHALDAIQISPSES